MVIHRGLALLFCLLPLVAVQGCTSTGGADAGASGATTLQGRWAGKPATSFFSQYGQPYSEYVDRGGGTRYTWRKRYTETVAASAAPDAAPAAAAAAGPTYVCELDILTNEAGAIAKIGRVADPRLKSGETAGCRGTLGFDG